MITRFGLKLPNPSILQFNRELSLLILSDVEIIQSYLDLIKCETFLDFKFVIHFEFLFTVKLSLEIAIFASNKGKFSFLLIK